MAMNLSAAPWGRMALGLIVLTLTGCGLNSSTPVGSSEPVTSLGGIAHGGPNPISGATVNYYATTSGGYGAAPTLLSTAMTGPDGSFTFSSPATCTPGQQAYVTTYGGNPGSGTNANYLLLAALGPCSTMSSNTRIWIDEVTTVAAAYALRPFITINTTGANPVVQIGAPANNNASAGSCTTASSVTTGCVGAGLTHAFANALNLANSVTPSSSPGPTGTAYTVTPSTTSGSVPTAMIDSLADSIEACVNSGGGSAGDASICGNLFTYTTIGGNTPTNTLQALLNIAQYPALSTGNVANVYGLATPVSFYSPYLSAAPTDYSLAISYSGPSVAGVVTSVTLTSNNTSGFGSGTGYITVPNVTLSGGGTPTTAATATASLGLTYFNVTGGTCTAGTNAVTISGGGGTGAAATATYGSGGTISSTAITAAGSGYTSVPSFTVTNCTAQPSAAQKVKGLGVVSITVTNPGAGYTSAPTVTIDAPTGTGSPTPIQAVATANYAAQSTPAAYALALDANDDVYAGWQNAAGTTGYFSFATGIASNGGSLFTSASSTTLTAPRGASTDTLGHVWFAENNTTTVQGLNVADGSTYQTLTTTAAPFGLGIDKSNNVWYGTASATENLYEFQQSTTYGQVSFSTVPKFTNPVRTIAFDANQNAFVSGFSATANTVGVLPNSGMASAPAYGTAGAPVINTTASIGASGAGIALDSSSNVWAPTTTGLFEVTPTFSGATVTALTPGSALTDSTTTPNYNSIDGSGNVWIPSNQTSNQTIVEYTPGTGAAVFSPCYAPGGATTCTAALSQPQRTQVDSTGSVWITSLNNGRVYQLLGTGSPTWPQLSLAAPGVEPQ